MPHPSNQRWTDAMDIARVAMGKEPPRRHGWKETWRAEDDPLAWWCLTELIHSYGNRKQKTEDEAKAALAKARGETVQR